MKRRANYGRKEAEYLDDRKRYWYANLIGGRHGGNLAVFEVLFRLLRYIEKLEAHAGEVGPIVRKNRKAGGRSVRANAINEIVVEAAKLFTQLGPFVYTPEQIKWSHNDAVRRRMVEAAWAFGFEGPVEDSSE